MNHQTREEILAEEQAALEQDMAAIACTNGGILPFGSTCFRVPMKTNTRVLMGNIPVLMGKECDNPNLPKEFTDWTEYEIECGESLPTYIAGPMRGYENFNFDTFSRVAELLIQNGVNVVSPAELDRIVGFDPKTTVPTPKFARETIVRDAAAVAMCARMVLLPGWVDSSGAITEKHIAGFCNVKTFHVEDIFPTEVLPCQKL